MPCKGNFSHFCCQSCPLLPSPIMMFPFLGTISSQCLFSLVFTYPIFHMPSQSCWRKHKGIYLPQPLPPNKLFVKGGEVGVLLGWGMGPTTCHQQAIHYFFHVQLKKKENPCLSFSFSFFKAHKSILSPLHFEDRNSNVYLHLHL